MNICVITTFDCSFEEFKAMLGEFEGEMQKCVSEWEIAKINDHKAVGLMNVTDMEMFTAMMSSPEAAELDAKYNICLLYTSPSPRDPTKSRMPSSA